MPSFLATSGLEAPAAIWASATRSLRTICSGVCLFFIENPPFAHSGPSDSHSSRISFRGAGQREGYLYLPNCTETAEQECVLRNRASVWDVLGSLVRRCLYSGLRHGRPRGSPPGPQ